LISSNTGWRFDQRGVDLGTTWRERAFNDASWPQGAPLLAYETGALPYPIRTALSTNQGKMTFYFRKSFQLPAGATNAPLRISTVIDDGAVFYCNGAEMWRLGMPAGAISYTTSAARTVDNAVSEGPFYVAPTNLVSGTNVIAAEVHQVNATSSDVVFGAAVELLVLPSQTAAAAPRLSASSSGQQLFLNWDQPATLEASPNPAGGWQPIPPPFAPATLTMTNARTFFRLRR
jgi:hypothetical protein